MFKTLTIAGWVFFAIDALLVVAAMVTRNMGDDAAGRGVAFTFGAIGSVFVLAAGAGLYFSARAHSLAGVVACMIPLAVPWLFLFGADVESYIQTLRSRLQQRKVGDYPEPAQRQLAKAIEAGDFDSMRSILATRPNLNGRDKAGFDLLSYAVTQTRLTRTDAENLRSVEGVRLLLDAGMDPNQSRDAYGGSTFADSASSVSRPTGEGWVADPAGAEVFRLLLEHGANANAKREGQPVIFSVWSNVDSMRELLKHGADIDARDDNGDTPLLFYLWNGRWDAALVVLEGGARLDVQNKFGTTPNIALANGKRIAEEIMHKPLPASYERVKAALERHRANAQ